MQTNNKAVDELLKEIEGYDKTIKKATSKKKSVDPEVYYRKAMANVSLSKLVVGDKAKYQKQALESFNLAIKTDGENALYLIDRSRLHVEMGNTEEAVKDAQVVSTLPKTGVTGMYVSNALRDIGKLNEIQDTIKALQNSGKIDPELARVLSEHASITSGLVVQVCTHGEELNRHDNKLIEHDNKIAELYAFVEQLKSAKEISEKESAAKVVKLQEEITLLRKQTELNSNILQGHTEELKDHEKKIDELGDKINILSQKLSESNLTKLEAVILKHDLEVAAQKELEIIEQDSCKLSFYNGVRWQMNSFYVASTAISTGMVENQKTGSTGQVGQVLESVSSHIPFVGLGVQLFGEILQEVDKKDQEKGIERYVELAVDSTDMARLSEKVARKLALQVGGSKVGNDATSKMMLQLEELSEKAANVYDLVNWAKEALEDSNTSSVAKLTAVIYCKARDKIKEGINRAKGSKTVSEYAKRFLEEEKEEIDPLEKKGELLAKIVVKELVKSIAQEKLELKGSPEQKAEAITVYLESYYDNKDSNIVANYMIGIEYDDPLLNEAVNLILGVSESMKPDSEYCTAMTGDINDATI